MESGVLHMARQSIIIIVINSTIIKPLSAPSDTMKVWDVLLSGTKIATTDLVNSLYDENAEAENRY